MSQSHSKASVLTLVHIIRVCPPQLPPNPASHLGLLSPMPSTSSPTLDDNVALKESILLAARGEIEATASVLAKVKALDKHINPPYLRGMMSKCLLYM